MFNRKRLTGLNPALLAAGYPLSPHTHRKVRDKAIDGLLPGVGQTNGIWDFDPDRIDDIAAALGLKKQTASSKRAA
jgi:hypothetical protein